MVRDEDRAIKDVLAETEENELQQYIRRLLGQKPESKYLDYVRKVAEAGPKGYLSRGDALKKETKLQMELRRLQPAQAVLRSTTSTQVALRHWYFVFYVLGETEKALQDAGYISADVFAGAETTLKERRAPEQKVGKCESLRAAVAVLQLFKSLLSLARPGQVQPADISEAFAVLVTMCFSRSLASTNARAGREVRPRTRAARRRRTRMQDGTHAWAQRTVRGDATTRGRRGDDAARVRGCRPRCRSSSLHQLA